MTAELDNARCRSFRAERALSVAVSSGNTIHQPHAVDVAYGSLRLQAARIYCDYIIAVIYCQHFMRGPFMPNSRAVCILS